MKSLLIGTIFESLLTTMKKIVLLFCLFLIAGLAYSQDLKGNWSGLLIPKSGGIDQAKVIYLNFESDDDLKGLTRVEILDKTDFSAKSFVGKNENGKINFQEDFSRRSSNTRNTPECKLKYSLSYDESTAYMKGSYESVDCRGEVGEVVLFRSEYKVTTEKMPEQLHVWVHRFIRNYKRGYPAPEILYEEQKNFKFKAIYFDHDDTRVRPEYYEYLSEMARILDAVPDLRLKITGHTDAVGPDGYNIGLSEKRADAIRAYFKSKGVDEGKLEIDFKGKSEPIASNKTREGKQMNRRVVFEFI